MNLPAIANATVYGAGVLMLLLTCVRAACWSGRDEDVGEVADIALGGLVGVLLISLAESVGCVR